MRSYIEKPIPNLENVISNKVGYRKYPIKAIVEDYFEVRNFGIKGENYYNKTNNPPYNESIKYSIPNLFVRETVLNKLIDVNNKLKQLGFELYVFDTFRPIEVQNYMHDVWCPKYFREQGVSEESLEKKINDFWAFGGTVDPLSPPPHNTGGAIDLTITTKAGEELSMGTGFDELTEKSFTDYYEKLINPTEKEIEIRNNRRLLYWAMLEEGFANNPTEWWHYSYGDQMWAKLLDKEYALYSNLILK